MLALRFHQNEPHLALLLFLILPNSVFEYAIAILLHADCSIAILIEEPDAGPSFDDITRPLIAEPSMMASMAAHCI